MPRFHLITLFPEFFHSPLSCGLLGRAAAKGLIDFSFHNPRDFSANKHRHIDDSPYGGGFGMVLQAPPLLAAARSIPHPGRIISLSAAGRPLNGALAAELVKEMDLTLICGRYEGIDARVGEILEAEEISVSDAVLNGGETAAMAVIESVCRFLPNFMGKLESTEEESFASGLLEFEQFTRPEICEGVSVPPVLLSGNHAVISAWRRRNSLARTLRNRPDLLANACLNRDDAEQIANLPLTKPGRNLSFCLLHYPVKLEGGKIGVSSLTNLDIHDIARISRSYGMAALYVLTPLKDQLALVRKLLEHWRSGANPDRAAALELVQPVASFEEMAVAATALHGAEPRYVAASAQWPCKPPYTPAAILELCRRMPVIICLGTARGLAREALAKCDGQLRPLRFLNDNHLSVRSAAAIIADRILGDFC